MSIDALRSFARLIFGLVSALLFAGACAAQTAQPARQPLADQLAFDQADIAFSDSETSPASGWITRALPQMGLIEEARERTGGGTVIWARVRFDRAALAAGPLALYGQDTRERFVVYLNGVDIDRSFADAADNSFTWNRPILISLPSRLLKPRDNELNLRLDTGVYWDLTVGTLIVGADQVLRDRYEHRLRVSVVGPEIVNGLLLLMSLAIFLMWLVRRHELELLWLAGLGAIWFFRDLHFYVHRPPFDADLFHYLTIWSGFVLTWAQYGFCAEFLKVRGREFIAKVVLGFALVVCAIQYFALFGPGTTTICYMIYFPVSAFAVYILAKACRTSRSLDHVVMLGAVLVCIAMMIHDFGIIAEPALWAGVGFLLVPYSGLIMFSAFSFSVGRRFVGALAQVEGMNAVLETRVAEATRSLEKSEQARHELQMVHAIESERERMMQEMHDGIGSSLTSALAMAQRRQESQHTIETLKRTLTDLKIAVDSLEPIEGDVIALMANLRHRVEPDLKEAGIRTLWNMSPCAPLPWLDPINALHVLRIMQEGISNVLTHAHATVIDFACAPLERGSRAGVSIAIGDNGLGMRALEGASVGRGLSNMRARAESVGGIFAFENRAEGGTRLMLWLPLSVAAEPVN